MSDVKRDRYSKQTRYVSFGIGAAIGSALGLILGSLLTFWLGNSAYRALKRGLRRITRGNDHPNFEMLLQ